MTILDSLERKFGHLAIPNLTYYLIGGQILAYIVGRLFPIVGNSLPLQSSFVLQGQWWRLFTMLFIPLSTDPIFAALTWYLYYIFGMQLETDFGSFRYFIYILIPYVLTVFCSFLFPHEIMTNAFIYTSLFLTFAYLHPQYRLYLFFIIPIAIKWFAFLMWIGIVSAILFGSITTKVLTAVSIVNFLVFFGSELRLSLSNRLRKEKAVSQARHKESEHYMVCAICKANEDDKKMFSYCHQCVPQTMYCEDHIHNHTHRNRTVN